MRFQDRDRGGGWVYIVINLGLVYNTGRLIQVENNKPKTGGWEALYAPSGVYARGLYHHKRLNAGHDTSPATPLAGAFFQAHIVPMALLHDKRQQLASVYTPGDTMA